MRLAPYHLISRLTRRFPQTLISTPWRPRRVTTFAGVKPNSHHHSILPSSRRLNSTVTAAAQTANPTLDSPPPPTPHADAPSPFQLRPYQEESISRVLAAIASGRKRLGLSLATGSGKTVIFTHLISRVHAPSPTQTQTLIVAHRQELVEQAAAQCSRTYPHLRVDVEMGPSHASGAADITVASIQSVLSGERVRKFDPRAFKLVIVDEAHRIVAPQYLRLGEYFGLRPLPVEEWAPVLVGVSATLARHDGVALGAMIDHVVFHRDYVDMIDSGYLAKLVFTTVRSQVDLSGVRAAGGDFQTGELSRAVNTDEANEAIVQAWKHCARGRRSTLVFGVDKKHVASLTALFRSHGVAAEFVTSDTPKGKRAGDGSRSAKLDRFKSGEIPVLINCGVFTEGTDIRNVDCVLLARPTKSRGLLIQMIGRGVRLHDGKEDCLVIDMVSTLKTGVVTTPTLFGLDPDELVENADVEELQDRRSRKEKEEEQDKRAKEQVLPRRFEGSLQLNFTTYDDVHDLIADSSAERHIRAMSANAWVNVGDYRYVLQNRSGDYMLITPEAGPPAESAESASPALSVYFYQRIYGPAKSKSPFMSPRCIAKAKDFAAAVKAADTAAQFAFDRSFVLWRLPWRRTPASEAQIRFLNKTRKDEDKLQPGDVLKGAAMDMITKLKFGAKGRFERAKARDRKALKTKRVGRMAMSK